ncbi:hypothetical protein [Streptococcus criceti]|uniref:hypothetical protein n=1 Tax=Streptococcus criceti TaxID=1333 RepID=UPI0012FE6FD8|nr:hypothetical protein [Streptococcus criceti]
MTKKFKNRKWMIIIVMCLSLGILGSCTVVKRLNFSNSDLTVTGIHNTVIVGKTSTKELEKLYGKPDRVETDSKKATDLFDKINNDEGSINVALEDNTDYWDTVKADHGSAILKKWNIDGYYEYKGKELAGVKVYFFISDDKVLSYVFDGDITDENIAKKDKYLRETIGA